MRTHQYEAQARSGSAGGVGTLVVPLQGLDSTWLPLVGGKAAHLGELLRGGFAVPDGFCVTTVAYAGVAGAAGIESPPGRTGGAGHRRQAALGAPGGADPCGLAAGALAGHPGSSHYGRL